MPRLKRFLVLSVSLLLLLGAYHFFWGQYVYTVTAYCNCPICINVAKHRDNHFASGKPIYWGGIAADPAVPFGTNIELIPHWPQDWFAVVTLLEGRRVFITEDRGGKIRGKHIDLFIPDSMGGHQSAKGWGKRHMRLKINNELV